MVWSAAMTPRDSGLMGSMMETTASKHVFTAR